MNYYDTFITVAPDTAANTGVMPRPRGNGKSVAQLEYELISSNPYGLTQEDVQFAVHMLRSGASETQLTDQRDALWTEFFSKPKACMRTSALPKSYGWGLHFNAEGKVALVAIDSPQYRLLSNDSAIRQIPAMRNRRT